MASVKKLRLAIVLDGGGRFVMALRVPENIHTMTGVPQTKFAARDNERLGLVPDRMPSLGTLRNFKRHGVTTLPDGEPVLMFKEEAR